LIFLSFDYNRDKLRLIVEKYENRKAEKQMPKEIIDENQFIELSKIAIHCRVKRGKEDVKLKLRTKKYLYTYKTDIKTADDLINKIDCSIIEL